MKAYIYCRVAHDEGFLELRSMSFAAMRSKPVYRCRHRRRVWFEDPLIVRLCKRVTEAVLAGRVDVVLVIALTAWGGTEHDEAVH